MPNKRGGNNPIGSAKVKDRRGEKHTEQPRQREAYRTYLRLGRTRSLARLWDALKQDWGDACPTEATLQNWSSWFNWQRRVQDDDRIIDGRVDERYRQMMVNAAIQHKDKRKTWGEYSLDSVLKTMQVAAANEQDGIPNLENIDPRTLRAMVALVDVVIKNQRLDDGDATDRVEGTGPGGAFITKTIGSEELVQLQEFAGVVRDFGDEEQDGDEA